MSKRKSYEEPLSPGKRKRRVDDEQGQGNQRPLKKQKREAEAPYELEEYKKFIAKLQNELGDDAKEWNMDQWKTSAPDNDQAKIQNEIFGKYNDISEEEGYGLKDVSYQIDKNTSARAAEAQENGEIPLPLGGGEAYYYVKPERDKGANTVAPFLDLTPANFARPDKGPDINSLAHEMVHANDHQKDQLTRQVWPHMMNMAQTGGGENNAPMSWNQFIDSMGKIRKAIDPVGGFSDGYYTLAPNYFNKEMRSAHEGEKYKKAPQYDKNTNKGDNYKYRIPGFKSERAPVNWTQLGEDIDQTLSKDKNEFYNFNNASEYPAYLSERLTNPFGANPRGNSISNLSPVEGRFIHNVLREMDTAYPADASMKDTDNKEKEEESTGSGRGYPVMNRNIRERAHSLERQFDISPQERFSGLTDNINPQPSSNNNSNTNSNQTSNNYQSTLAAPAPASNSFTPSDPYGVKDKNWDKKRGGGYIGRVLMGERKARGGPVGMSRYLAKIMGIG